MGRPRRAGTRLRLSVRKGGIIGMYGDWGQYLSEELLDGSAAESERRSVDDVLADAVQRYLEYRSWTKLLDYGAERAKALGIEESDIDRLIAESRVEQRKR